MYHLNLPQLTLGRSLLVLVLAPAMVVFVAVVLIGWMVAFAVQCLFRMKEALRG